MKVIVIGAGIAGLATAALLAEAGYEVTVIEKNTYVGGRAHYIEADSELGAFRFDCGPSWYLMPEAFEHFYELLGTSAKEQLDLRTLEPAYRIFSSDVVADPLIISTGREKLIAQAESLEPGSGPRMAAYLDKATTIYELSLRFFLYTNFDSLLPYVRMELARNLLFMLSMLRMNLASYVEGQFTSPVLRKLLQYPAVFLSTIPAKTPALYSLLSHTDLVDGVRYPMGGFSTFINSLENLCRERGVKFILGAEAVDILYTTEGKDTTARGVRIHVDEGYENLPADIVVSAGDRHHTETALLPANLRTWSHHYWEKRDPGISALVGLVGLKGKLPELGHHQLFLSDNWNPDFRAITHGTTSKSFYVCKTTATDDSMAPADCENLFILIPTGPDTHLGHGSLYQEDHVAQDPSVERILDEAITVIAKQCGMTLAEFKDRILIRRSISPRDYAEQYFSWRSSALGLAHTLDQSAFFRGHNYSSKVKNLYYAGATSSPGVGIPMCLISAENVLKKIRGIGGTSPLPRI